MICRRNSYQVDIEPGMWVRFGDVSKMCGRNASGKMDHWSFRTVQISYVSEGHFQIYGDEGEWGNYPTGGWDWFPDIIVEVLGYDIEQPDHEPMDAPDLSALFGGVL